MDLTDFMKGGGIIMPFIGFIIGVGLGLWLSSIFIFPSDVLNLKLAAMTIGDFLRIIGGLAVTIILGIIGGFIGSDD
jgi:hypothetical protein